jgi:hypothetical protein
VATNPTTRPIPPICIDPTGCSTCSSSDVGCPAGRDDSLNATHSASSPFVGAPNDGPQPVSTGKYGGLQPSILRATAVSSPSAPSARNRRHGQTTSMTPVPVRGSILVVDASDLRPAVPIVAVSESTADQPTAAPEEQQVIQESISRAIDSDLCHSSITLASSPPTICRIRIVRRSQTPVQSPISIVNVETANDNEATVLPQESGMSVSRIEGFC